MGSKKIAGRNFYSKTPSSIIRLCNLPTTRGKDEAKYLRQNSRLSGKNVGIEHQKSVFFRIFVMGFGVWRRNPGNAPRQ
jgi:hypothetical protein